MKHGSRSNAEIAITPIAVVAPPFYLPGRLALITEWADGAVRPPDFFQMTDANTLRWKQ